MARRRSGRKIALDILYEHEVSGHPVKEVLARYEDQSNHAFVGTLVNGVQEHQPQLDSLISEHSKDWAIERMPVIDRILLRIALFEILHLEEVPAPVAINEAVEMAKTYSTEDSSRFINGMLGKISSEC